MSKVIGIDLGTTNSLVATVDSGIPLVIADADGQRLTPSVVHYPAHGAEPIVGHKANRVRGLQPAQTVYSVKRFIGRRGNEIQQEEMLVTYPVRGEGAGMLSYAAPVITSVTSSACANPTSPTALEDCPLNAATPLTVDGRHFGSGDVTVL